MAKQLVEFNCTECHKYFDFKLNMELNGNYRIHCPNCDHIHYRVVKDGVITQDRFGVDDDTFLIEDIRPMKASCRDEQKETFKDLSSEAPGFLHRLWKEMFPQGEPV